MSNLPNIESNLPHEITLTAFTLGILFGVSLGTIPFTQFKPFNLYIVALSIFHFLEYYITAKFNPLKVNSQSFLINNGMEYTCAHILAILECLLESYFFPDWKTFTYSKVIIAFGCLLLIMGQIIRSLAMFTAGRSFSHIIQTEKIDDHILVTNGIYSFSRHPSYLGFFWWAIGTQLMLLNPFTLFCFIIILYRFFSKRIAYEEIHLIEFFNNDYVQYKERVGTWIPFIK